MIITSGNKTIEVQWIKKKIKHMYLRLHKDGSVVVSSPMRKSEAAVREFVESKAAWILKKQNERMQVPEGTLILQGAPLPLEEIAPLTPEEYINQKAKEILPAHFSFLCNATGLSASLKIKPMRGKYGYCTPTKGEITLNPRLIIASPQCIDYVIIHELMHLYVPAHNHAFHCLVQTYLPDEKEINNELNRYPI